MIDFTGYIFSGLVTMQGGEGGDALQKTAFTAIAERIKGVYIPEHANDGDIVAIQKCEIEPGIWVRFPDTQSWYGSPLITTRDQITPLIIWAGFAKQPQIILRQLKQQLKRFGRYQNTHSYVDSKLVEKPWWKVDIPKPDNIMQYYRALYMANKRFKLLLPLMLPVALITDTFMLGGVLVNVVKSYGNYDFAEDDNLIAGLFQAKHSFDTPFSWLARVIYFKFRAKAGINIEGTGPQTAVLWKHRKETGAPPIGELWNEILAR